jgi:hypothetical protein
MVGEGSEPLCPHGSWVTHSARAASAILVERYLDPPFLPQRTVARLKLALAGVELLLPKLLENIAKMLVVFDVLLRNVPVLLESGGG